jgi:hypothetical protein
VYFKILFYFDSNTGRKYKLIECFYIMPNIVQQYYGFITTNCDKIQERLYQLSDINQDGKVNIKGWLFNELPLNGIHFKRL